MRASKSARNIKPSQMLEALILLRRESVDAGAVRRFATGHKLKVLRVNLSGGTMVHPGT